MYLLRRATTEDAQSTESVVPAKSCLERQAGQEKLGIKDHGGVKEHFSYAFGGIKAQGDRVANLVWRMQGANATNAV